MAHATNELCQMAIGLLLLQTMGIQRAARPLLAKLRERVRVKKGQNKEASLGITDSQSVRWGNNPYESKSYDYSL